MAVLVAKRVARMVVSLAATTVHCLAAKKDVATVARTVWKWEETPAGRTVRRWEQRQVVKRAELAVVMKAQR